MATNPGVTNTCARNMADEITALMDAGSGASKIRIYSGAIPADTDTAASGTLLAELVCTDPFAPAAAAGASGGLITASSIADEDAALDTDTAGYFRGVDSDNNSVFQGTAGTADADLTLNTAAITAGSTVSVTSLTINVPEE